MNMKLDDYWPTEDLEHLSNCPMCGSGQGNLAFSIVKDWAFECAPGNWSFYKCVDCDSLYITPRPTEGSIHKAYGNYYTHSANDIEKDDTKISFSSKLYNEYMFHIHGIKSGARLNLKSRLLVSVLSPFIYRKFPLDQLSKLPRGNLLDIGCGDGSFLATVNEMGFKTFGIEIDLQAYKTAKERGLEVLHGSYKAVESIQQKFDYVVCSHVLEHVHDQIDFVETILKVTKPSSTIFLSWPNPESIVLKLFKHHWRGLEAPRHLCIPSVVATKRLLSKHGWEEITINKVPIQTVGPSMLIRFGKNGFLTKVFNKVIFIITSIFPMSKNQDIIELICKKSLKQPNNEL